MTEKYFIPISFDKETFEGMLDREISDEQWATFVRAEHSGLVDYISQVISDYIDEVADEYFREE